MGRKEAVRMRRGKRFFAIFLSLCLLAGVMLPAGAKEDEEGERVNISSVEDLLALSQSCSLDTWSQGRTVVLTADLNLTGSDFAPIPSFGGTFLGEGHTISGLKLTEDGSCVGLFRFLQEGARVQDLHVSGRVAPGGSADSVGGIAGCSAGVVEGCTFRGTVAGKSSVGGIVGLNEAQGEVADCLAEGTVSGENGTGGIVGRSLGLVLNCENGAAVNTSSPDEFAGAAGESALDQLSLPGAEAQTQAEEIVGSHTDTGGIAGYSEGIVQGCVNRGAVGYQHVGYNLGGVAGRQAGYMRDCSNQGAVCGRKDVGGIVGQAEPDIVLNTDGDTLGRLRQELNTLNTMIDRALERTDAGRTDISARLTAIGNDADTARNHTKVLLDQVTSAADGSLGELNTLFSAVTAALEGMGPALDAFSMAGVSLQSLGDGLGRALDTLEASGDLAEDAVTRARDALASLRAAGSALSQAAGEMNGALQDLQQAVAVRDQEAVKEANRRLGEALRQAGGALGEADSALKALKEAWSGQGDLPELEQITQSLSDLGGAMGEAGEALGEIGSAIGTVSDNTQIGWPQIQAALESMKGGLESLEAASQHMTAAMGQLEDTLAAAASASDALGQAAGEFSDAAKSGAQAAGELGNASGILGNVSRQLARDGNVQFTPLGREARDAGDGLYVSLTDLSENLKGLQASADSAGSALSDDLGAISLQITKILNLMLDMMDHVQTGDQPAELFGDVSEEDIEGTRMGKAQDCVNTGAVEGDRNVGGIAGAVAVEYSLDPEDDASPMTFGSTYELKAILQGCVNRGEITGKRDCVGGAAGRMDLGTAIDCENYGGVTGVSYVGGIAGYADAAVRECWAKCSLQGSEYVGGIAGWLRQGTGCRSIAQIVSGTEYAGSIAGDADLARGDIQDNLFLDMGLAGIDGVSYGGIAEPAPFEALQAQEQAPAEFLSFALTLRAQGETVARIPFRFGEDLSRLELPEVPEQEGCYGVWPEFDPQGIHSDVTLEAVYSPWITLTASREQEGELALALAEGQFTEDVLLEVAPGEMSPPEEAPEGTVWQVTLTGAQLAGTEPVPIRLLNRGGGRAQVWQEQEGRWVQRESTVNGSYLCLTMTGPSGTFCIQPAEGASWVIPAAAAAGAGLAVLLCIVCVRKIRRGKGKTKRRADGGKQSPEPGRSEGSDTQRSQR